MDFKEEADTIALKMFRMAANFDQVVNGLIDLYDPNDKRYSLCVIDQCYNIRLNAFTVEEMSMTQEEENFWKKMLAECKEES